MDIEVELSSHLGKAPSLDCAMQGGTLRVCTMGGEPVLPAGGDLAGGQRE